MANRNQKQPEQPATVPAFLNITMDNVIQVQHAQPKVMAEKTVGDVTYPARNIVNFRVDMFNGAQTIEGRLQTSTNGRTYPAGIAITRVIKRNGKEERINNYRINNRNLEQLLVDRVIEHAKSQPKDNANGTQPSAIDSLFD